MDKFKLSAWAAFIRITFIHLAFMQLAFLNLVFISKRSSLCQYAFQISSHLKLRIYIQALKRIKTANT